MDFDGVQLLKAEGFALLGKPRLVCKDIPVDIDDIGGHAIEPVIDIRAYPGVQIGFVQCCHKSGAADLLFKQSVIGLLLLGTLIGLKGYTARNLDLLKREGGIFIQILAEGQHILYDQHGFYLLQIAGAYIIHSLQILCIRKEVIACAVAPAVQVVCHGEISLNIGDFFPGKGHVLFFGDGIVHEIGKCFLHLPCVVENCLDPILCPAHLLENTSYLLVYDHHLLKIRFVHVEIGVGRAIHTPQGKGGIPNHHEIGGWIHL